MIDNLLKNILLISMLLLSGLNVFGQDGEFGFVDHYTINKVIGLSASDSTLIKHFGPFKAGEPAKQYWEIDDVWVTLHTYGGKFNFWMLDNWMVGFEIVGPGFSLYYKDYEIKVGDHIETFGKTFPLSYANRRVDNGRGSMLLGLSDIYFREMIELYDRAILIQFDPETLLLTKISYFN